MIRLLSAIILAVLGACALTPPQGHEESAAGKWADVGTSTGGMPYVSPALDSDDDRIPDDREGDLGSDPNNRDSDRDGFDDDFEDALSEYGFDLLAPSSDADQDGLEASFERKIGTSPNSADTDGDAWSDLDEVLNRFYGYDPLVSTLDSDFDGLSDELERRIRSLPNQIDSNGDGLEDFQAYSAGLDPAGPKLVGDLGDLAGTTYSDAMRKALIGIRAGERFPIAIAKELPYPRVIQPIVESGRIKPSGALMQRSVYNPHNSPLLYQPYSDIVSQLFATRDQFDGNPGPNIVRLFRWSQLTLDCCDKEKNDKPGRRIYAMKISANPEVNDPEPEILFLGMHHARELISATFTMALIKSLTDGYLAGNGDIRKLIETKEIWIIPVVNPNGYERAHVQLNWRKNTRNVSPSQSEHGVDVNRNYGFEHATSLTTAQRAALDSTAKARNGISPNGDLNVDLETYPGPAPFTEVESQAVRGLAHNQFLTKTRDEIDGLICSLSWHTFTGLVGHPMGHKPSSPNTDLTATESATLGKLTDTIAVAMGYQNARDTFDENFYPAYGGSEDWLFKDGQTLSSFVEAYSPAEGQAGLSFYPSTPTARDFVAANNVRGALALIAACPP